MGIDLINFHDNINGMFYGQKRKIVFSDLVKGFCQYMIDNDASSL